LKYHLTAALFAGLILLSPLAALASTSWWSYAVQPANSELDYAIRSTAQTVLPLARRDPEAPVPEQADAIRLFVNQNSVHRIDDTFYSYWQDISGYLVKLAVYANTPIPARNPEARPSMACETRSAAMHHLPRAAGIRSRFVVITADVSTTNTHTFLEVYDPASARWTIQDPDANIVWKDKNGRRAGIVDLLRDPVPENFTPCRSDDDCGADSYTQLFIPYIAIDPAAVTTPIYYNPDRFDRRDLFFYTTTNWAYCAVFGTKCAYELFDALQCRARSERPTRSRTFGPEYCKAMQI